MWALRRKPLPAEFLFQPHSIPTPRCVPSASGGQGLGHADPKGKETQPHIHQRPPAHRVPDPGLCAHTAPMEISPGSCACLLHTLLRPKGFSLRISDFPAPTPGLQPHWALELERTCSPCPHNSTASQGSAQLPHTDLAYLLLLPRVDVDLHKDRHPECHVWQQHQTKCVIPHGVRTRSQLHSQKEKAKAWGLMGKVFYKWRQ